MIENKVRDKTIDKWIVNRRNFRYNNFFVIKVADIELKLLEFFRYIHFHYILKY